MRENGTDRDIALLILDGLNSCATLVAAVNDNLYVPHITTQPTDQEGAIDATVNFQVVANNVASYQWQTKVSEGASWFNSTAEGATTATLAIVVTETRYAYFYRCAITGKDGSTIYSNTVKILQPEAEG